MSTAPRIALAAGLFLLSSGAALPRADAAGTTERTYLVTFAMPAADAAASDGPLVAASEAVDALARTEATPIAGNVALVTSSLTEAQLRAAPGVATVELDRPLRLHAYGDEPGDASQWHLQNATTAGADMDAFRAWGVTTGTGVVVAIGDTGVQRNHPDLAANMWRNTDETNCANGADDDGNGYVDDCYGWDFGNGDNEPSPGTGGSYTHGTHVAGIAAAPRNGVGISGVAPGATIMPLKIATDAGSLSLSSGVSSIMYAADNGARVYNASWGASGTSSALASALAYARTKGMVVVASAGNSSLTLSASQRVMPASYATEYDNVINVASSDANDNLSSFSNRGDVTLTAPGSSIYSTLPGSTYGLMSGTSMAAPATAGAAALVAAQNPSWTPAQIRALLVATVETKVALSQGGAGRVNAAVAVGAATRSGSQALPPVITGASTATAKQATVWFSHANTSGVTGYTATATNAAGAVVATVSAAPGATSATLTGLLSSTWYRLTVTATGSLGTAAGSTTVTTPLWKVGPLAATNVTATQNGAFVDASWTLPSDTVTKIRVQLGNGRIVNLKPWVTSYRFANPGQAGSHVVNVWTLNKYGSTLATSSLSVQAVLPDAPAASVVLRSAKAARVEFAPAAGSWVTGYVITVNDKTFRASAKKTMQNFSMPTAGLYTVTVTPFNPFGNGTPTVVTYTRA